MNLTVAAMRLLSEKGFTLADIIELAEANEIVAQPSRNANAERQARYRQRNRLREQSVTGDARNNADEGVIGNVIDISAPTLARPSPPDPPTPPTLAQRDIFATATREAVEPIEKGSPKRKFLISETWEPSDDERRYAIAEGMTAEDISRETTNFRDHFIDKQERRPGWTRSWQRWCRTWASGAYRRRPTATPGAYDPTSARNHGRTASMFAGAALAAGRRD